MLAEQEIHEPIAALAHETPYFVFSRSRLLGNLAAFRRSFPDAAIHYALKANSEPCVLQTLADAGASFEAASVHELALLQDIGVEPARIIYGTSVKPAGHIRTFAEYGIDRFACDCCSELEKIAASALGSRVYVRLAVNDASSVFQFSEKSRAPIAEISILPKNGTSDAAKAYFFAFCSDGLLFGTAYSSNQVDANSAKLWHSDSFLFPRMSSPRTSLCRSDAS
jgi:hypothetical protein